MKRGECVRGVCPDNDEWAVRHVRRERILMIIEGRGCCNGVMSVSKWVAR